MTTAARDDLWIRRYHPAPDSDTVLVCFPHAGGSATFYFPVARALSPRFDVLAVQYPGRQDRWSEPCVDDLPALAEQILPQLLPWSGRRLALFGHSMGATVAFEVARLLERSGTVPAALFASARRAPSRHRDESVHQRDDEALIREIKELNGTNSAVLGEEELMRMILPTIRSDFRAAETYRFQGEQTLNCPITALVGKDDPKATVDEADAWREHTTGEFVLKVFTGGHFYLAEQQEAVLKLIAEQLG
jgi:pyochelin biosynthetic protein PchC